MTHMIDISASFESNDTIATNEAIAALLESAKTSDDEPLLEVLHCSIIPDQNPEHRETVETHAVIRAQSHRFDAEGIKPWLDKMLNDSKEGQPILRSIDVLNASTTGAHAGPR